MNNVAKKVEKIKEKMARKGDNLLIRTPQQVRRLRAIMRKASRSV